MKRNLLLFCALAVLHGATAQSSRRVPTTRQPAVAGSFYPADSAELAGLVQRQLDLAGEVLPLDGVPIAFIVPHAGLIYSGPIAAYSYKLLAQHLVKKVILCGPAHTVHFEGLSVYGPGIVWRTPFGEVACDDGLCTQMLAAGGGVSVDAQPHLQEHSLEVQLPFLQHVLGKFTIVPVTMGNQDAETIDALAAALDILPFDSATVMIAATDWQHYRPAAVGHAMDSIGVACLERLDPDGLIRHLRDGSVEACGGGVVAAVARAALAKGADRARILKVGDSGDVFGDKSSVVGYVAAVLYKSRAAGTSGPVGGTGAVPASSQHDRAGELSPEEKQQLLAIARQSITARLAGKPAPQWDVAGALNAPATVFVTLTEHGQLRGCFGTVEAGEPLYLAVSHCAVSAATADPRFVPVSADEIPRLKIEISVLTPMTRVVDLDEIEVGRDGLMIRSGRRSGLLLPQVATEYNWDRAAFIRQTCFKAGLPPDAYLAPEAALYRFQALVFGESD